MEHKAASRFDEKYQDNKCPNCLFLNQNFIKVSDGMLACYKCGTVFIAKYVRDDFQLNLRDILKAQEQDRSKWVCEECGKICKTKNGLMVHSKVHKVKESV